jgi:hypothetical protein
MLICLGDEGLNTDAIESWKWTDGRGGEMTVIFPMNRIVTYTGSVAAELRRVLRTGHPGLLQVVIARPRAENGGKAGGGGKDGGSITPRVDAAQQVLVAAPVGIPSAPHREPVPAGTLNT